MSKQPKGILRQYCTMKAVKNSSWGEDHKTAFGDRAGYVICRKRNRELEAVASVIGVPFVPQEDIDATAALLAYAPTLYRFAVMMANHDRGCAPSVEYMDSLVLQARAVVALVNDQPQENLFYDESAASI